MSTIITQVIDPFEIATQGISSSDPITIATNGFVVFITEEIIDDGAIPPRGHGALSPHVMGPYDPYKQPPRKKKKRITATVIINGKEYTDSVESEDLTITVKDIHVEITNAPTPNLTITVMRGNK